MGSVVSLYDPCMANKMVKGNQMTINWHVDDLKVSHLDRNGVTMFILQMNKHYGPNITVSCRENHDYHGMDLDYSKPGKAMISMIK